MKLDRLMGAALGLAAFVGALLAGLMVEMPLGRCIVRALVALALGVLVGWAVFGKIGLMMVREAASGEPAAKKKEEPQGGAEGPPK